MSSRFHNKLLSACAALIASAGLVAVVIGLDAIAPKGTILGWMLKTVPLAVVIPAMLIGFNATCDWYYDRFIIGRWQHDKTMTDELPPRTAASGHSYPQHMGTIDMNASKAFSGALKARRVSIAPIPIPVSDAGAVKQGARGQAKSWIGQ